MIGDDDDLSPEDAQLVAQAGGAPVMETRKAAKPKTRTCVDCPAEISTRGGKKRCAPCYDKVLAQRTAARSKKVTS